MQIDSGGREKWTENNELCTNRKDIYAEGTCTSVTKRVLRIKMKKKKRVACGRTCLLDAADKSRSL